jgi:MinD superfamily P-loop ATPase
VKKKVLSSPVVQKNKLVPSTPIQTDSLNVIKCLPDCTIYAQSVTCGALYKYSLPNNSKLISGIQSGKKFPLGNNKIVYEVMYKNTSKKCEFNVMVLDTIKPGIVCPLDKEVWFET